MHVVGDQRQQVALALTGMVTQRQFQQLAVDAGPDVAHNEVAEVADGDQCQVAEQVLEEEEHHHGHADHQQRPHLSAGLDQLGEQPVEGALEPLAVPQCLGTDVHRLDLSEQQPQEGDEQQQRGQVEDRAEQVEHGIKHREMPVGRAEAKDPEEVAHGPRAKVASLDHAGGRCPSAAAGARSMA